MKLAILAAALLLQDADAPAAAREAIAKTRASSSYRVTFKATIRTPGSDPMVLEGESVWVKPGVLYIHSKASGGDEKRIVRVGREVFLYHEVVEEWVGADEAGQPGAGRGIQNPEEVLAVLAGHLDKAAFADDRRSVRLALDGGDIEKIMKEQASHGSFDWASSSAGCTIGLAADGRISRFATTAQLASRDPALAGKKVDYAAEVEVVAYEQDRELTFALTDPKTKAPRPLEISPAIREKIDALLK